MTQETTSNGVTDPGPLPELQADWVHENELYRILNWINAEFDQYLPREEHSDHLARLIRFLCARIRIADGKAYALAWVSVCEAKCELDTMEACRRIIALKAVKEAQLPADPPGDPAPSPPDLAGEGHFGERANCR